jgi:chromate reductase
MSGVSLLGICGSVRKASMNRVLLRELAQVMPEGSTLSIYDTIELPIFNSDLQDPPSVVALKDAVTAADGVVFAVPEYNYSIPGGLKNGLDWLSRPPATSPMRGKPIGLVGCATGMSGSIRAQLHMRQMLVYSDAPCMSQPEVLVPRAHERIDKETGKITDESTVQLLAKFGAAFVAFVQKFR